MTDKRPVRYGVLVDGTEDVHLVSAVEEDALAFAGGVASRGHACEVVEVRTTKRLLAGGKEWS